MRFIDDEGFVLGRVNIVDLLVILLVLAILVSGVSLVTASPEPEETHTQSITFRTTPAPDYVIDAITLGRVPTDDIAVINSKTVTTVSDGLVATLALKLKVPISDNGPVFRDQRLYVGRSLRLDFETTIVDGTVIDMQPIETRE